jgi:hypothetical protein
MRNLIFLLAIIIILVLQGCYPSVPTHATEGNIQTSTSTRTNTPSLTTSRTPTSRETSTPTRYFSPLPTVDISNVPSEIIGIGDLFGFSASDVEYLLRLLRKVARNRDPYPLLDFIQFPIHVLQRCPGDVIENSDEFIERFPEFMDDTTRYNMMNLDWKDVFIKYDGMGIKVNTRFDVWFVPTCSTIECVPPYHINLVRFFDYGTYRDMVEGNPTPKPTYNPKLVKYGEYGVTSKKYNFIKGGQMMLLDDKYSPWKKFTLKYTNEYISMGPFYNIGVEYFQHKSEYEYCFYKEIEVCQPSDDFNDFYSGGYSLGDLLFICSNSDTFSMIIMADNQIGYPVTMNHDFGFLVLDLKKE